MALSDRGFFWFSVVLFSGLGLGLTALLILGIGEARRIHRAEQALSPAERAVAKHVMPDGTICYQPRDGWSRPLSCLRGDGETTRK